MVLEFHLQCTIYMILIHDILIFHQRVICLGVSMQWWHYLTSVNLIKVCQEHTCTSVHWQRCRLIIIFDNGTSLELIIYFNDCMMNWMSDVIGVAVFVLRKMGVSMLIDLLPRKLQLLNPIDARIFINNLPWASIYSTVPSPNTHTHTHTLFSHAYSLSK